MQSFGDLFANNRLLALGLLLAALAVILAMGIGLYRLTFGRRLHMAGGRTRQPRLGVVDAFDLDRQRQLVIVRRDNVEHLLMIGGPNDVLIEAAIVRAAALGAREKDNGAIPSVGIPAPTVQAPGVAASPPAVALPPAANGNGEAAIPLAAPSPSPQPPQPQIAPVAAERDRGPMAADGPQSPSVPQPGDPRLPAAATLAAGNRALPPRPTPSTMPPRAPVTPVARPAAPPSPRPNFSRATPVAPPSPPVTPPSAARVEPMLNRPIGGAPAVESNRTEGVKGPAVPPVEVRGDDRGGGSPAVASVIPPPNPPSAAPSTLPQRQAPTPRPNPVPVQPRPQPVRTPPPPPLPARAAVPSLTSLEEEMAKLLGRPMPPSDPPEER